MLLPRFTWSYSKMAIPLYVSGLLLRVVQIGVKSVGDRSGNSKFFLRITKINLGETSNERGECIFIPLKIAKRKRYKNAVDGVVLAAIQIAVDPIKCRTDGTSAFNTRTAR